MPSGKVCINSYQNSEIIVKIKLSNKLITEEVWVIFQLQIRLFVPLFIYILIECFFLRLFFLVLSIAARLVLVSHPLNS